MVEKVCFGYIWQNIVSDDLGKLRKKKAWLILFCKLNIAHIFILGTT